MKKLILDRGVKIYAHLEENGNHYVIPPVAQPKAFAGNVFLWALDEEEDTCSLFQTTGGYRVRHGRAGIEILFDADYSTAVQEGVPSCDFLGNAFCVRVDGSDHLERAMANFYWKSLLNQCAERSFLRNKKWLREGYVLSTLETTFYGGTYPAVDHEFHIRGRLAMGDAFDLQLVRRMLELQLRLMRTDWRRQFRIPCSLQPHGRREYRVYRKSQDKKVKAVMFLLTGVMELVEELYQYYCLTKDIGFVTKHLGTLERGLCFAERFLDQNGRLWGDVYYEDQVMKDGANAQAQAFAVHSFRLMARLETIAGVNEKANHYAKLANRMQHNYIQPVPGGYWSEQDSHYVDWIDRQGVVHDHIHLLSNALSVTFGFNDPTRNDAVNAVIEQYDDVFQKFPSFVAAKIEDYTESEIGVGGPYDLCAAGRYWCHDAKSRREKADAALLKRQLERVAQQAGADNFDMGERYDMNYIYYNTGEDSRRNWHGSPSYYEYPNVFLDVLVHDFLGIRPDEEADLLIAPCCTIGTEVSMESFGVAYQLSEQGISIQNISNMPKKVRVDLSKIFTGWEERYGASNSIYTLSPAQSLQFEGLFLRTEAQSERKSSLL